MVNVVLMVVMVVACDSARPSVVSLRRTLEVMFAIASYLLEFCVVMLFVRDSLFSISVLTDLACVENPV